MSSEATDRIIKSFSKYPPLVHRKLDLILAIGMGVSAYYLYERRTGREPGHSLYELVKERYF